MWVIVYLFVQTFCKFQLLQQFLLLVAEAVVLLRTRTLKKQQPESDGVSNES